MNSWLQSVVTAIVTGVFALGAARMARNTKRELQKGHADIADNAEKLSAITGLVVDVREARAQRDKAVERAEQAERERDAALERLKTLGRG